MRAATYQNFGDPSDVLEPKEVDAPSAAAGQVLVRTILSPIHNHDLWTVRGEYGYKPKLPAIGGSEAVGIIEGVGEEVPSDLIGQRVAVAGGHGTWAELFVASASAVIPLPSSISDELGSQLIAMPFSAISLLESLDVVGGDWVIQTAANGAVGKVMATLAARREVNLINIVRSKSAAAELEEAGIGNIIVTADPDWKEQARALSGEQRPRAAVDSVGGAIASDLADLLGYGGVLVTFGTATGEPLALNSGTIIFKQLTVRGFWGSKVSEEMPAETKTRLFTELISLAASGELILPIGGTFSLHEATKAVRAAQVPGRNGKILIRGN